MKYRSELSQLKTDLAAIRANAPTARLELYDADGEDPYAAVVSFGGIGALDQIRVPREMGLDDWLHMIGREVR